MLPSPANRKVRQPVVLSLATARADRHVPAGLARQLAGTGGLSERADLVDLEQEGVRGILINGALNARRIGAEQVVAQHEGTTGQPAPELRPVRPVVFRQSVLDADDRPALRPVRQQLDHGLRRQRSFQAIATVPVKLAGRHVQRKANVLPRAIAGVFDGQEGVFEHVFTAREGRRQAAFVRSETPGVVFVANQVRRALVDRHANFQGPGHLLRPAGQN